MISSRTIKSLGIFKCHSPAKLKMSFVNWIPFEKCVCRYNPHMNTEEIKHVRNIGPLKYSLL